MLFTINGFRINDFKATNCVKAQWKQATTNAKSFETRISKYILPWRDVRIVQRRVHIPSRLSMICHCKNVNFRYCFSKLLWNLCIVKNLLIKCGLKFPSTKVSGTVPYSACYPFGGTLFESGQQWTEVDQQNILLSAEIILSYCIYICDYLVFLSSNNPEHWSHFTPKWRNCRIILELWYQWNLPHLIS